MVRSPLSVLRGRLWLVGMLTIGLLGGGISVVEAVERNAPPTFYHGVATVVGGILWELPKTVVESTMSAPPIVGLVVGLLAWPTQVSVVVARGVQEMAETFDPWGIKHEAGAREVEPVTSPASGASSAGDQRDHRSP